MNDKAEWINDLKQIPTASIESLRRALIDCGGVGKEIKEAALNEILGRSWQSNKVHPDYP